jgi:Trypsin-like peptidase domain
MTDGAQVRRDLRSKGADRGLHEAKSAIVKVGDGRGFVVEGEGDRFVITAGHCLPKFPSCHSDLKDRTYEALLGPLGEKPAVWAECRFADPIGDIAVLASPDDQALPEEFFAYQKWVHATATLKIADAPQNGPAWLLSLDGRWCRCLVRHNGCMLWISDASKGIFGGMSGSPIVADDGSAIGIVCTSGGGTGVIHTEGGPNPRLVHSLPAGLLGELGLPLKAKRAPQGRPANRRQRSTITIRTPR